MSHATRLRTMVLAMGLLVALVLPASSASAAAPANVVLTYDCSNMRDPQLSIVSTRHAMVEFVRLSKYRWRLRAYPDIGHPIRVNLWETERTKRLESSRGRLVHGAMEWVIPLRVLEGCR